LRTNADELELDIVRSALLSAIVAISVTSTGATAQQSGTLVGIVSDTAGRPIASVFVTLTNAKSVLSSESGAYTFRVPPGPYTIAVEALGYVRPKEVEVRIRADEVAYAHFQLTPAELSLTDWRGCSIEAIPPDTRCLSPARVPTRDLWVATAGEWVFRNEQDWHEFWAKHWNNRQWQPPPPPPAPAVDWTTDLLVAVSEGTSSGCDNAARYINRVMLSRDSTVVVIGPEKYGSDEMTCSAVIEPVDVAVIPRDHYGPIVFRKLKPTHE
jgi:hypothetical protein